MDGYIRFQDQNFWNKACNDKGDRRIRLIAKTRRGCQLMYGVYLKEFLNTNVLGQEVDLAAMLLERKRNDLEKLERDKSFMVWSLMPKKDLTGLTVEEQQEERSNEYMHAWSKRFRYWNLKVWPLFLEDRIHELNQSLKTKQRELEPEVSDSGSANNMKDGSRLLKPETLDDLFVSPDKIEPAIEILKRVNPPLLTNDLSFAGRNKFAFKIWLDKLRYYSVVKPLPNDESLARMLEHKFKGLALAKDGSTLRKMNSGAADSYKKEFNLLVSQLSQSGRKGT